MKIVIDLGVISEPKQFGSDVETVNRVKDSSLLRCNLCQTLVPRISKLHWLEVVVANEKWIVERDKILRRLSLIETLICDDVNA